MSKKPRKKEKRGSSKGRSPSGAGKPRVSLCMIVKNENHCLRECLESAAPYCKEMIVVDTGSTDGTPELAELLGAKVLHFPWIDDFSAARNFGIDAATGDWILVLDADERLVNGDTFLKEIQAPGIEGMNVLMTSDRENGTVVNWYLMRAFRNRPENRFENRIHEQAMQSIVRTAKKYGTRVCNFRTEVHHIGYLKEVADQSAKDVRNLRILRKAVEEDPENHYLIYKLAECLLKTSNFAEAGTVVEKGYKVIRKLEPAQLKMSTTAPDICAQLAKSLSTEGKSEEAWETADWAHKNTVRSVRLEIIIGDLAMGRKEYGDAVAAYRRALVYENKTGSDAAPVEVLQLLPRLGLVRALIASEQLDEALEVSTEAFEMYPEDSNCVRSHADVLRRRNEVAQAIKLLNGRVKTHKDDSAAWLDLGDLLFRAHHFPQALNCLSQAEQNPVTQRRAHLIKGECFLHLGRVIEAGALFDKYPDSPVAQAGIMLIREIESGVPNDTPPSDSAAEEQWRRMRTNLLQRVPA